MDETTDEPGEPAELQSQLQQASERLRELAASLQEATARNARLEQELAKVRAESESQLAKAEADRRRALQNAGVAAKTVRLRERDLSELQARYAQAVEAQQQQQRLLDELERKLRTAAAYFRQMQQA